MDKKNTVEDMLKAFDVLMERTRPFPSKVLVISNADLEPMMRNFRKIGAVSQLMAHTLCDGLTAAVQTLNTPVSWETTKKEDILGDMREANELLKGAVALYPSAEELGRGFREAAARLQKSAPVSVKKHKRKRNKYGNQYFSDAAQTAKAQREKNNG